MRFLRILAFIYILAAFEMPVVGQAVAGQAMDAIDPALRSRVDRITTAVLEQTGVPSASVAVVQHGKLVYTHAYGKARLDPRVPATTEMRYAIGSISKQFTAAAI